MGPLISYVGTEDPQAQKGTPAPMEDLSSPSTPRGSGGVPAAPGGVTWKGSWPQLPSEAGLTTDSWPQRGRSSGVFLYIHDKLCFQAHFKSHRMVCGPPHFSSISWAMCLQIRPLFKLWLIKQDERNHKVQKATGDQGTSCPCWHQKKTSLAETHVINRRGGS